MDRDVAIRIDGMLSGALAYMDSIAHFINNNLSVEEIEPMKQMAGAVMGEIVMFSMMLHKQFPDIIPKELDPNHNGSP